MPASTLGSGLNIHLRSWFPLALRKCFLVWRILNSFFLLRVVLRPRIILVGWDFKRKWNDVNISKVAGTHESSPYEDNNSTLNLWMQSSLKIIVNAQNRKGDQAEKRYWIELEKSWESLSRQIQSLNLLFQCLVFGFLSTPGMFVGPIGAMLISLNGCGRYY